MSDRWISCWPCKGTGEDREKSTPYPKCSFCDGAGNYTTEEYKAMTKRIGMDGITIKERPQ